MAGKKKTAGKKAPVKAKRAAGKGKENLNLNACKESSKSGQKKHLLSQKKLRQKQKRLR